MSECGRFHCALLSLGGFPGGVTMAVASFAYLVVPIPGPALYGLRVVQGVALFIASTIVVINFAVDLAYSVLDPRIRYE